MGHHEIPYTDAEALAAAIAGGLSKVVWKDASEQVLSDLNRTTSLGETDLDLTAYTSANAKFAILALMVNVDSITAGSGNAVTLNIRKNGTTPNYFPRIWIDGGCQAAGSRIYQTVIVGLDAGQVIEYRITITGTVQIDSYIGVVGYIE